MRRNPIERLRAEFVDPRTGERSEVLGDALAMASRAVGEIYRTRGDVRMMEDDVRSYLTDTVGSLGERGVDMDEVMREVMTMESGNRLFHERFAGQIHPWGLIVAVWAQSVGAMMNTNRIVAEVSPTENKMEGQALDFLAEMFGYEIDQYRGNIVSGGTEANICALWVAREKAMLGMSRRERRGARLVVMASEMAHYSVAKACDLLQMEFVGIPMDGFKADPKRLERNLRRIEGVGGKVAAVIGIAGETETGMVEDLRAMAEISRRYGAHFHVDAAYGGPGVLSRRASLFNGIELADSITIDPHKLMYLPYSSGAVLFRNAAQGMLIEKGMRDHARYLLDKGEMSGEQKQRNYGMSTVLGSMPAGSVIATWATMRLFGKEGIATVVNHGIDMTEEAYKLTRESRTLRPIHKPELNTLLVGLRSEIIKQLGPDRASELVRRAQVEVEKRGIYVSSNEGIDGGVAAFRTVWMSPFTDKDIVREIIGVMDEEVVRLLK